MRLFAYIDAGTGSLFIQAIFGVALASGVVFRTFIRRAFSKVRVTLTHQEMVDEEV